MGGEDSPLSQIGRGFNLQYFSEKLCQFFSSLYFTPGKEEAGINQMKGLRPQGPES